MKQLVKLLEGAASPLLRISDEFKVKAGVAYEGIIVYYMSKRCDLS